MSQAWSPPNQLTIAQIMWSIVACAVACAWPVLLLVVIPALLTLLLWKLGLSVTESFVIVVAIGIVAGLLLPLTVRPTHCRFTPATPVSLPPSSPLARLTEDGQEKARPVWSPDGKRLTFARHELGGAHIWQYIMTANDPRSAWRLTDRKAPDFHASYFPDGKRLIVAVVELSGTQGNVDLSVIGEDGKGLKKVVGDLSGKLSHQDWPSPSPDGSRFAFSSTHEGNQEIYACKSDGIEVIRLTQSPGHDAHPCWSPKGEVIAFATDRWGGLEIATVKPDGTGLVRLTRSPGIDDFPAISPDGSRVAFVSQRDGNAEIYVMDADGSNPANLSNHPGRDTQPSWTPDGKGVTFVSDRDGGTDLYTLELPAR
ncbi:MAG: periplasmic component of the Tol biopolymer transport system [Planctomycetota bacterium]|nr:periplasmic component of the Tol biopolymer transport system [Planctomycetota bacterium]